MDTAIKINNLSKIYKLYNSPQDRLKESLHPFRKKFYKEFYALKDINLEIKKGEILGIVGKNGSGKSTLLKIIAGVLTPTTGTIQINGSIAAILELGSGFNPEYTGIENIYHNLILKGYKKKDIDEKINEIIEFTELGVHINQPVKTYSSGMSAKLAFAVNTCVDPDILILDEVLSVGDALFQRKCFARMEKYFNSGKTVILVSHNMHSILTVCTKALLIIQGKINKIDTPKTISIEYEKYLFSKENNTESVLPKICTPKFDSKTNEKKLEDISNTKIKDMKNIYKNDYLIADFVSKSVSEYKNFSVDIYDVCIKNRLGNRVNFISENYDYIYSYKVRFNDDFDNAFFGMQFKLPNGVIVTSANTLDTDFYYHNIQKDSIYELKWIFHNNLCPNTYFTNAGVSMIVNNNFVFLNRIIDATCFKVQSSVNNNSFKYLSGIVNVNLKVNVVKTNFYVKKRY